MIIIPTNTFNLQKIIQSIDDNSNEVETFKLFYYKNDIIKDTILSEIKEFIKVINVEENQDRQQMKDIIGDTIMEELGIDKDETLVGDTYECMSNSDMIYQLVVVDSKSQSEEIKVDSNLNILAMYLANQPNPIYGNACLVGQSVSNGGFGWKNLVLEDIYEIMYNIFVKKAVMILPGKEYTHSEVFFSIHEDHPFVFKNIDDDWEYQEESMMHIRVSKCGFELLLSIYIGDDYESLPINYYASMLVMNQYIRGRVIVRSISINPANIESSDFESIDSSTLEKVISLKSIPMELNRYQELESGFEDLDFKIDYQGIEKNPCFNQYVKNQPK